MVFKLDTSGHFYNDKDKEELETLGFKFERGNLSKWILPGEPWSKIDSEPSIELKTLEDLMQFVDKWGTCVLSVDGTIELYDDYRE